MKRPLYVVDHSPPSGAEVKNVRSYNSPPPLLLCLHVEEMDSFTFACASVCYWDDGLAGYWGDIPLSKLI